MTRFAGGGWLRSLVGGLVSGLRLPLAGIFLFLLSLQASAITTSTVGGAGGTVNFIGFPNTPIGTTLRATVTVSGAVGATGFALNTVNMPAVFAVTSDTCTGATLTAALTSCTFVVTFTPTAAVFYAGSILITTTNDGSSTVNINGSGAQAILQANATEFDFGEVDLNAGQSVARAVTIRNVGVNTSAVNVRLGSVAPTGFEFTNNECNGVSLAPNAQCTITVRFVPTQAITYAGFFRVQSDTAAEIVINLTGKATGQTGTLPTVTFLPDATTGLDFGSVVDGNVRSKILKLTAGSTTVEIASIITPRGYESQSTCGSTLPANQSCAIVVSFPFQVNVNGNYDSKLVIQTNATGAPHEIPLKASLATVATGAGRLTIEPNPLNFGTIKYGKAVTQVLRLKATDGDVSLGGFSIPLSGRWSIEDLCGAVIPSGTTCALVVGFGYGSWSPEMIGDYSDRLVIASNDPSSPHIVNLSVQVGAADGNAGTLVASRSTLDFGTLVPGKVRTESFTLRAESKSIQITSLTTTSSAYTITESCSPMIPANGECSVSVTFKPTARVPYNGSMLIASNSAGSPMAITLRGSGGDSSTTTTTPATLVLESASYDYGSLPTGQIKTANFALSNRGGMSGAWSFTAPGEGFLISGNTCGSGTTLSVPAGGACRLSLDFLPQETRDYATVLRFSGSGADNVTISLRGKGIAGGDPATGASGRVVPETTLLNFGGTAVGGESVKEVALTLMGGVGLSLATAPAGFTVQHNCVPGADRCVLTVRYRPQAAASHEGFVTLTATNGSTAMIAVMGSGLAASGALPVSMRAEPSGSSNGLTLTGAYLFQGAGGGGRGNFYVAAVYQGQTWFITPTGTHLYVPGTEPPSYRIGDYSSTMITIFNGQDLSLATGAEIYLAYGASLDEVLRFGQYQRVYVVR